MIPQKGGETMKRLLILAAWLPFAALAQPLNTTNNPNLPDYKSRASSGYKLR